MKNTQKIIKNITKTFAVAATCLFMSASAVQMAHADSEGFASDIVSRPAPARRGAIGLTITGQLPRAATADRALNEQLNTRFTTQFNDFVEEHMGRAATLEFSKDVFASGDFVSVVVDMTAISATTTRARATTVINTETNEIITLSDFNQNALPLINARLNSMIEISPRLFVSNFTEIDNDHPFYMRDNVLVIPFASGTFAAGNRDIHTESFTKASIHNEAVEGHMFTTLNEDMYNTIMVRLVDVATMFGFTVTWDAEASTATIDRMGEFETYVIVGENTHGLEIAPEIINGRVHVPLSFFREVLGIASTVTDGEILMTKYQGMNH